MEKLTFDNKYSFFTNLFGYLLKKSLIDESEAVNRMKKELVHIENALSEANVAISFSNSAVVTALIFYKLSDNDKFKRFSKWIAKNHITYAKTVNSDDIINIFDKVYDNIPKKAFLARWYPAETDGNYGDAQHRYNAIKSVVESCGLELVDIGTQDGGTFDIRSVMYREIKECDIFIADLTGCRHNVMVEVGYALNSAKDAYRERMLFYFAPTDKNPAPPFDLNGFKYEQISDSADIEKKVKPHIEKILDEIS
jgi:hypothetical protein